VKGAAKQQVASAVRCTCKVIGGIAGVAESRHSLQVRNPMDSAKKADAQGISSFFLLCKRGEWRQ
jgi:hypothetical protein